MEKKPLVDSWNFCVSLFFLNEIIFWWKLFNIGKGQLFNPFRLGVGLTIRNSTELNHLSVFIVSSAALVFINENPL